MGYYDARFLTSLERLLNSMYALSILYSSRLKGTGLLGSITVALCVSASFTHGSLTATRWFNLTVLKIAWISFFINLGRGVIQGIQDVEGDRSRRVRSVAIAYGSETAAKPGSIFIILGQPPRNMSFFLALDICLEEVEPRVYRNITVQAERPTRAFTPTR